MKLQKLLKESKMSNGMKKFILFSIVLFLTLLFLPINAEADTHNAASCSYADVNAAITAASAGDTVSVPAGTCTWTTGLSITKGINLIGAGRRNVGNTVITNGRSDHDYLIYYNPSNYTLDTPFRVSGFTFDQNNNGRGIYLGVDNKSAPFTVQTKVRIDNNKFIHAATLSYQAIYNKGTMNGVVDNNTFDGVWYPIRNDPGLSISAAQSWYQYFYPNWDVGNAYTMIYEDNEFLDLRDGEEEDSILTDCQYVGRYLFRYNTISLYKGSQNLFDFHGYDAGGKMYGCFGVEIYGNEITALANGTITLAAARSGKSMIFNNAGITSGTYDSHYYNNAGGAPASCPPDYVAEQIIHDSYLWSNRKNLTAAMDNVYSGYPMTCNGLNDVPLKNRDWFTDVGTSPYVSCGTLSNRPATCSVGQGYWATNQSCTNLTGMVGANPTTPISGTLYKCTGTNTWTAYFTPYTYPHPLRPETPQSCTYTYSAWGACQSDNTQTRTVISSSPSGCTGTPVLTQSCVYTNFLPEQYIQAESGQLSSMQTGTSGSDTYVYTAIDNTGSASFTFNIQQPGEYMMSAKTNSNNDAGQNSFYLGLDSEQANGNNNYVYDVPITSAFTFNDISLRGFVVDPMIWNLSAGNHTFTFYGRESNTWLDQIILKRVTVDTTPPAAPTGVIVN